jgi:hypothetical protein
MTRSGGLAVPVLLLLLLAATATAAIKPLAEAPQDDKPMDHLAHGLPPLKEEPAARIASAEAPHDEKPPVDPLAHVRPQEEEPAARVASAEASLADLRPAEKRDGGGDAAMPMPMEAKPTSGVAIQGGDPGTVPSGGSGNGNGNDNGSSASGEHGKEQSGGSSKEAEKSAGTKSCLTKEECHKKRLLCGKGCTLSAHAKCAAKCSKSCIPTC